MRLTWYFYLSCQVCSWRSNLWMWFCRHWLTDESFGSWPHFKIHGIWKLSSMMWYNIGTFWQGDVVADYTFGYVASDTRSSLRSSSNSDEICNDFHLQLEKKNVCICNNVVDYAQASKRHSASPNYDSRLIPKYIKCNRKTLQQSPAVK